MSDAKLALPGWAPAFMGVNKGSSVRRSAQAGPNAAIQQGGSPDPSCSTTSAGLGLSFLDVHVSTKTEEPENEEHDNYGCDVDTTQLNEALSRLVWCA